MATKRQALGAFWYRLHRLNWLEAVVPVGPGARELCSPGLHLHVDLLYNNPRSAVNDGFLRRDFSSGCYRDLARSDWKSRTAFHQVRAVQVHYLFESFKFLNNNVDMVI